MKVDKVIGRFVLVLRRRHLAAPALPVTDERYVTRCGRPNDIVFGLRVKGGNWTVTTEGWRARIFTSMRHAKKAAQARAVQHTKMWGFSLAICPVIEESTGFNPHKLGAELWPNPTIVDALGALVGD